MVRATKRNVILALAVLTAVVGGYLFTRPPVFVGYRGNQLEMQVQLLPQSVSDKDVPEAIRRAKAFWQPPEGYWPQPVSVTERETSWWVKFGRKEETFRSPWGTESIRITVPGGNCIQVEKSGFSCRFIPTL